MAASQAANNGMAPGSRGAAPVADTASSAATVVDADHPLPLLTMSYAQLTRRYGPALEALVVAAVVDDGIALFVPSTGFVGFHRCGKRQRREKQNG